MSLFYHTRSKHNKTNGKSLPGSVHHKSKHCFDKETPRCTCLEASYTLEAAIILPLLACFFVSILIFFRIMQVQLEVQKALDDTGRKMAVYAAGENINDKSEMVNQVMARGLLLKELSASEAVKNIVTGNRLGINLMESELSGDYIDLKAVYHVRIPVRLLGIWDIRVVQRARCRKWTGWHRTGNEKEEDIWVYITETGVVYHMSNACSHLALSIKSIERTQLEELHNEYGGKYDACTLCAKEDKEKTRIFITNQGDCFHNDLNCSGIKRTVSMIRLSEIGDRRKCSRCSE